MVYILRDGQKSPSGKYVTTTWMGCSSGLLTVNGATKEGMLLLWAPVSLNMCALFLLQSVKTFSKYLI